MFVFALALLVRVLFLFATSDRGWPHSVLYEGDAPVWVRWAQALDRGEAFEFDLAMRTPAIAYILHWLIPGAVLAPFTLVKLAWCVLSAATCAILYLVVAREASTRVAWIASMLLCFSFGSYELATSLNNEAPYAFAIVLLIGATLRWVEEPRIRLSLALGVLHGLAMLLRAEHSLVLVAFLLWSALAARSRRAGPLAVLVAGALLVCLPWSWRSHIAAKRFNEVEPAAIDFSQASPPWTDDAQEFLRGLPAFARQGNFAYVQSLAQSSGRSRIDRADLELYFEKHFGYVPEPLSEWSLVSSKGALDFALANHPGGDGGFSRAALHDGTDANPEFAFGRPSHLKLYNHGFAAGRDWIRADFTGWLWLVEKKLGRFFDGVTLGWTAWNLPHGRASQRWPVDIATPLEPSITARIAIAIAILAGIAIGWRRNLGALCLVVLGCKLALTVLFYGYARQAASIAPVFFVFGAVAIDAALTRIRCPARVATALGISTVLVLLGVDVANSCRRNDFDIRGKRADATITRTPEWGPGAFESFDGIEILPR